MQRFPHGGATPIVELPTGGVGESSRCRSPLSSLSVPAQPFGSEVGESLEAHQYSNDVDYHQLLKDYRKVQALSSSRLNAEMLRGELDAAHDTLQVSKNEAS